ncbi:MAG: hydrogenase maturation protease [Bacillota bacterium]
MKTIILGIGNPILGDDGIGVHIARELQDKYSNLSNVTIDEAQTGGMNLIDLIRGYDRAILIDAISIPNVSQGCVKRFDVKEMESVHSFNPHDVTLLEALDLSEKIGDRTIPKDIIIIGINLKVMPLEFSDSLSSEIREVMPKVIEMVLSELNNMFMNN